jgi:hypothetical protein
MESPYEVETYIYAARLHIGQGKDPTDLLDTAMDRMSRQSYKFHRVTQSLLAEIALS